MKKMIKKEESEEINIFLLFKCISMNMCYFCGASLKRHSTCLICPNPNCVPPILYDLAEKYVLVGDLVIFEHGRLLPFMSEIITTNEFHIETLEKIKKEFGDKNNKDGVENVQNMINLLR